MRSQCKSQGMASRGNLFLILAAICAKCQANSAVCNFDHSGKVRENSAHKIQNMKELFLGQCQRSNRDTVQTREHSVSGIFVKIN